MKNVKLLYHFMPWEIDYALLTFTKLKKAKYYLPENVSVSIDVALNLSSFLIDWDATKLPKEYFIDKYCTISKLLTDYDLTSKIYDGDKLYGHLDFQREVISPEVDYYVSICPDMYFNDQLLADMIALAQTVPNEYFVITPQICRMWDESWEIITHPKFAVGPHYGWEKTTDIFDVDHYLKTRETKPYLTPINQFRWAGWFDLYNKAYYEKLAPVPESWSGYGGWDTYGANICFYARQFGLDFQQYRIDEQIVFEYGIGPLNVDNIWGFSNYYKSYFAKKDVSEQRNAFNQKIGSYIQERVERLYAECIAARSNQK